MPQTWTRFLATSWLLVAMLSAGPCIRADWNRNQVAAHDVGARTCADSEALARKEPDKPMMLVPGIS